MSTTDNISAQYLASGDPALKDYYPAWVNNMADDATVEGSMLDGVVEGLPAAARSAGRSQRDSFASGCDWDTRAASRRS